MSTATQATYECEHCGECQDADSMWAGSFCSSECFYTFKGKKVLSVLKKDHKICGSCWARVKHVNRPTDDTLRRAGASHLVRDAFVGFEHPTPQADHGEVNADDRRGPKAVVRTGTVCRCGQTDLRKSDEILQRAEGGRVVVNLLRQLYRLYDEGAIDHAPSKDRLFEALRESGGDFEYAVGFALRGGE